ncbi:MAG: DnaJ domain-containing protein [Nitrospirota bacterium]
MENYYEILGIAPDADEQTIKRAYHILVKEYHPDSPAAKKTPGSPEKFRLLKEAYETLVEKKARENYDKYVLKKPAKLSKENEDTYKKLALKHYEQGRDFYKSKKYRSASRSFHTAMNLDPDNSLYCSWLGISLSHIPGKLHEAKTLCEKAVKLSPNNADYRVNLAIVYRDAGIKSLADKYFREALEIDPDNQRAHSWIGKKEENPSFFEKILGFFGFDKTQ